MSLEPEKFKSAIREVPDFPKPGILFYDITTLLKDSELLVELLDLFEAEYQDQKVDSVVAIESRGFILAGAIADRLNCAFVPVRKPGKLPSEVKRIEYNLEYGTDALEIHADALYTGERVLVIDDVLATGGTAQAALDLLKQFDVEILGVAVLIELLELNGKEKLGATPLFSILQY